MGFRYLSLFLIYINIKIGVRLAGGHLYGKQLSPCCRWCLFVLSFFPLDVLDEIWDVIESVSEGFLTYSYIKILAWSLVSCALKTVEVLQ